MIFAETDVVADVRKVGVALIAIERLVVVRKRGVEDVEHAVVLEVADRNAHRRGFAPRLVQRVAGGVAHVFKGAVAFVEIEIVRRGVVAHQQVGLAVVVDVDKHRAQAVVAGLVGHAGLVAYVGKSPVAVVVEEMIGFALQAARTAGCCLATKCAKRITRPAFATLGRRIVPIPMQVPGNKEIEPSRRRRSRPTWRRWTSCRA